MPQKQLQSLLPRSFSLAAALATAVLLSMAMPGHVGWWPLLFIGLVPLLTVVLCLPPRRAACTGFFTGFIYHAAQLYWIVIVLDRYGGLPVWLSIPAMLLLAAYMSCYLALFCFLLSLIAGRYWEKERSLALYVWAAPVLWVGLDVLRSFVLTGFPWMDLGYGLYRQPQLIQAADLGGHVLITFSLVLCNTFVVAVIDRQRRQIRWGLRLERRALLFAVCFLIFIGGYSMVRYQSMDLAMKKVLRVGVGVIQGNIDQGEKWTASRKKTTVAQYIDLSRAALVEQNSELIVWPETALPFYPQNDPLAEEVSHFVSRNNIWFLTGAPAFTIEQNDVPAQRQVQYYNSALLYNPKGGLKEIYHKQHLVPFGEYVPLRSFLPFLKPLVVQVGDFSAGTSSVPLEAGRMKLGILICFESIFPEIARQEVRNGANLLVNLTNDAWYGRSSAPHQSLAMAVFRAVETKRSLIRAANTGISSLVSPTGEIIQESELFLPQSLMAEVPLYEELTVFSRTGRGFGAVCLALVPCLFFLNRRR